MKAYFEGWYFKHQANGRTLALIPGKSIDEAFIQVVTNNEAYYITYPLSDYHKSDVVDIGGNIFSDSGILININRPELKLKGEIDYENLVPIKGDIMGPFKFFPMECRHGIMSMNHDLSGCVKLNGETYNFDGGKGYIESDSGKSFPDSYTWVHCNDFKEDCSITAAVAKIPFYGLKFWGCICVITLNGKEYRLATYKGVKIVICEPGIIELKQGKYCLLIKVHSEGGHSLPAPRFGKMNHAILEDISCQASFKFTKGKQVLFDSLSHQASYEYH